MNKSRFFLIVSSVLLTLALGVVIALSVKSYRAIKNLSNIKHLSNTEQPVSQDPPFYKILENFYVYEKLASLLKTYDVQDENGSLKLIRHGREYDGGYVTAVKALEKADVLLGYGIYDDNSFEDDFSLKYNKPSYGFDCGVDHIDSKSELFTLVKECIASDSFLYNKASNADHKITSFTQQLDSLNLRDKNIFLKMDIEGAEYDAFEGINKYYDNITGIVLEIHFINLSSTKRALKLLQELNRHFALIHVHGNNCCISTGFSTSNSIGIIPNVIELSYINKNLVTNYKVSENQSHPTPMDQQNVEAKADAVFEILVDSTDM